jgi:hypothetical protein
VGLMISDGPRDVKQKQIRPAGAFLDTADAPGLQWRGSHKNMENRN